MQDGSLIIDDEQHDRPQVPAVAEALNPLMLLQQAVEKGMDPGQLKALVDLQEQWRAARAKEAFSAAMNAVQIEMPCIVRDAHNEQTKSNYIRLETITHQAKPIYTKHGFSLSFSEDNSDKPNETNKIFKRIVCLVRHVDGHSERHWIDLPIDGFGAKGNAIGQMNPVQGAISTGSYGQRVLTCRVFNITIADTDLDGQAPNPPADPKAPKAPPRGQRPAPQTFAVSKQQMGHLASVWKGRNLDPDGNVERQRAALSDWLLSVANRGEWNPKNQAEWRVDDYVAGCRALNIEPEGLE